MVLDKISIVIAAYNRPDYLYHAIESAIQQDYPVLEIIVVDDCSIVDLKEVIGKFDDERLVYFKKQFNLGVCNSWNKAISMSKGDFILFLDDDDVLHKNKVASNLKTIREKQCDVVLCSYNLLDSERLVQRPQSNYLNKDDFKKGNVYCGMSGVFCKRDVFEKISFDEDLVKGVDWDLFIRMSETAKIYFDSSPLYDYRVGHASITTKGMNADRERISQYMKASEKHRSWLGERLYKERVARILLAYIGKKKNKLSWIYLSFREAGISATSFVLISRLFK